MNMRKRIGIVIFAMAICLSLCACGISKDEAVGTWTGTYVYNGSSFSCAFVLSEDGTYDKVTYKDGSLSSAEAGTYEVKSGKVILHKDGNTGNSTVYKYKDGKLVNNDHEFSKK